MTAVEWLIENLISEPYSEQDFKYNEECWDRAIEMEKEQKIEFACAVYDKYNFGPQDISFREECVQFKSE